MPLYKVYKPQKPTAQTKSQTKTKMTSYSMCYLQNANRAHGENMFILPTVYASGFQNYIANLSDGPGFEDDETYLASKEILSVASNHLACELFGGVIMDWKDLLKDLYDRYAKKQEWVFTYEEEVESFLDTWCDGVRV